MTDAELQTELDTDPVTMGYAAAGWSATPPSAAQYQAIADLINDPTRSRDRDVSGQDLFLAILPADFEDVYLSGTAGAQKYLDTLFQLDEVPLSDPGVRAALGNIFSGKAATIAALQALQVEAVSRAQEIGLGKVKVGDLKRLKGDV